MGLTIVDSMACAVEAFIVSNEVSIVISSGTIVLELVMMDETDSSVEGLVDMEDTCTIDTIDTVLDVLASTTDSIILINVDCGMMEPVSAENDIASVEVVGIGCVGDGLSVATSILGFENEVDNEVRSCVSISIESVFNTVLAVCILSDIASIVVEGTTNLVTSDDTSVFKDLLIVPRSTTMLRLDVDEEDVVALDLIMEATADACNELSVVSGDENTCLDAKGMFTLSDCSAIVVSGNVLVVATVGNTVTDCKLDCVVRLSINAKVIGWLEDSSMSVVIV